MFWLPHQHVFQALQFAKHSQPVVSCEVMITLTGGGLWLGLDPFDRWGKRISEALQDVQPLLAAFSQSLSPSLPKLLLGPLCPVPCVASSEALAFVGCELVPASV